MDYLLELENLKERMSAEEELTLETTRNLNSCVAQLKRIQSILHKMSYDSGQIKENTTRLSLYGKMLGTDAEDIRCIKAHLQALEKEKVAPIRTEEEIRRDERDVIRQEITDYHVVLKSLDKTEYNTGRADGLRLIEGVLYGRDRK